MPKVKASLSRQAKIGRKSRTKGNAYENKIAKVLGTWWCQDPSSFKRRPRSGGWPTKHAEGDLVGVTEVAAAFPFIIDTKKREGWRFEQLLCGTGPFKEWWDDICDICNDGRLRLLIISKNHDKSYAIFGEREMAFLTDQAGVRDVLQPRFEFWNGDEELLQVMVLDDFLTIDPEKIRCAE